MDDINLTLSIVITSIVIGLIENSVNTIFFIILTIFSLCFWLRDEYREYIDNQIDIVDTERKKYFSHHILKYYQDKGIYSLELKSKIYKLLGIMNEFDYRAEFIDFELLDNNENSKYLKIIDAEKGKEEMLNMQKRVSFSQIILITGTLFFTILSLVLQIKHSTSIILLYLIYVLIDTITYGIDNSYKVTGWSDVIYDISTMKNSIIYAPHQSITKLGRYFKDVYQYEITGIMEPRDNLPAFKSLSLILQIAVALDQDSISDYISVFLDATKDLPTFETDFNITKRVYANQYKILTYSSTFFSSIIAGMIAGLSQIVSSLPDDFPIKLSVVNNSYLLPLLTTLIVFQTADIFLDEMNKKKLMTIIFILQSVFLLLLNLITHIYINRLLVH